MAGRPKFQITKAVCEKAETLAAQGLTLEQVARSLGISRDTLNEKRKAYSDFSDAIKRGQANGIEAVTNALFAKAMGGDNTAMIFYLKNRDPANWRDIRAVDARVSGAEGGPLSIAVRFVDAPERAD